jgi:hypothetical protein
MSSFYLQSCGPRSLPEHVDLGSATPDDVPELLALWAVAAENDGRPGDTAQAILILLERDPGACLIARQGDRIVGTLIAGWDGNQLGQALWQASGYLPQAEWRRWIKPVAGQPAP